MSANDELNKERAPRVVMASELLNGSIEVSESEAFDMMKRLDLENQAALLYKFDELVDELLQESSLSAHITAYMKEGSKVGPWVPSSLITCTDAVLKLYGLPDLESTRTVMR